MRGRFALHDLDGVPAGTDGLLRRGRIDGDAVIPSSLLKGGVTTDLGVGACAVCLSLLRGVQVRNAAPEREGAIRRLGRVFHPGEGGDAGARLR
ncbi:hypothetical protein ADK61_06920 [Streptomyces sp. XY66]|nr:hypothetical protein ADK61_06920 [Streptomyces sp. XY66]